MPQHCLIVYIIDFQKHSAQDQTRSSQAMALVQPTCAETQQVEMLYPNRPSRRPSPFPKRYRLGWSRATPN